MHWREWRLARIAGGVVLAALLGFTAIAAAALSTTSESTTVAPDHKGSVTAACPRGSEAVAGGFAGPGFDPGFEGASLVNFDSHRTSDREWRTQAHNYGDDPGELDAYTVCASNSPPIAVKSKTRSISPMTNPMRSDPQGVGTAIAKCPKGSEAVSGGSSSPGNSQQGENATYPFTSKRVGERKWKVQAINENERHAQKLRAYAYCDKREPGLGVAKDSTRVPAGDKATLDLECPNGGTPVSGGFASRYVPSMLAGAFTFTSRPISEDRWRISAFGTGGVAKRGAAKGGVVLAPKSPLTAYAYCK